MADTKIIRIQYGENYTLSLFMDQLHLLPVSNWRKICRMIRSDAYQNTRAIEMLSCELPKSIADAKADLLHAEFVYAGTFRDPNTVPRGQKTSCRARNARNRKAVTEATKKLKQLEKFYSIFKGGK